ncbi:FAD binding domain-containing protein [Ilumatobacter sp.]|uniref:FAD binding domain-containing protein n=1 Tax=Ilumatobacter sp. TaxID=1967498 RepID=UPI003B5235DA
MTMTPVTRHYARRGEFDGSPAQGSGTEWYAGGTDVIPLSRTGVVHIETVIDLKVGDDAAAGGPGTTIEQVDGSWRIGALTTLADLAGHDGIADDHPAIGDAISQAATLQIRHRATVGGNLLQRPRCSYFRDPEVACWMKGGDSCPAEEGRNEHHALVDEPCIATQPSDLASVLVALDARVAISGADGDQREVGVADLLQRPSAERRSLHTLQAGELITSVSVPAATAGRRSTYLKAMDRAVWQFALVGVAVVVDLDDDSTVTAASLVASGLDSVPRPLVAAADSLVGSSLGDDSIAACAALADDGLVARSENGYKRILVSGLVRRALEAIAT